MKLFLSNNHATTLMLVFVVIASTLVHEAKSRPYCPSTFFAAFVQLMPCREALAPFSLALPSQSCCAAVKALGQPCWCVLANGPQIEGVDIGMTMQLPLKCAANFQPCEMSK
ncbi:hypothetical protein Leryth_001435 [Lithospermum erythrorhizon]|nr:hypothetical protein Leryth_001435 [Lithospermum erythrorhizon]